MPHVTHTRGTTVSSKAFACDGSRGKIWLTPSGDCLLFSLNFQNRSPSQASSFINCERRRFKWFKSKGRTLCVAVPVFCVRPPVPCSIAPLTHNRQTVRTLRGKCARAQHDCLFGVSLQSVCRRVIYLKEIQHQKNLLTCVSLKQKQKNHN